MKKDELIEYLAETAHRQWSNWMKYLFQQGTITKDGRYIMPKYLVERWQRQMNTCYSDLPEDEKESDISEAHTYYYAFKEYLDDL